MSRDDVPGDVCLSFYLFLPLDVGFAMSREMSRLAMSREIICLGCLRSGMLAISLPGMLRLYLQTDILVQLVGDPQRQ